MPRVSLDLLDSQVPTNLPTPKVNKELGNLKVQVKVSRGKSAVRINQLKEMRKVAAYEKEQI